jgi:uncharacterized protein (DUF1330 family)
VGKVYTVVAYRSVSDPAALAAYAELAGPAIIAGGGRILARGMPLATFDGGLNQRMVIVEWDNLEQALATRRGEAYQAAFAKLGDAAERDIRIVEGVDLTT